MRELDVELSLYSLHRGGSSFDGMPIERMPKWKLLSLLWLLPFWALRKPRPILSRVKLLLFSKAPCRINRLENALGFAFAVIMAFQFRSRKPDCFHAVWATAPAAAAQLLEELIEVPYTMGAHAYDVFRSGGDWLLKEKLNQSKLIHTSTGATRARLLEKAEGVDSKLFLIRRGMNTFPAYKPLRRDRSILRILSVGRLIAKKGYYEQLAIFKHLKDAGFLFEAKIVGWGELEDALSSRIQELGLQEQVQLCGKLSFDKVVEQYQWADVFMFCGKVADDGDRDGLPNVVAEAMASGLPVISTRVGGVPEAVTNGESGMLLDLSLVDAWRQAFIRLQSSDAWSDKLRSSARFWVEEHFDATTNAHTLLENIKASVIRD